VAGSIDPETAESDQRRLLTPLTAR